MLPSVSAGSSWASVRAAPTCTRAGRLGPARHVDVLFHPRTVKVAEGKRIQRVACQTATLQAVREPPTPIGGASSSRMTGAESHRPQPAACPTGGDGHGVLIEAVLDLLQRATRVHVGAVREGQIAKRHAMGFRIPGTVGRRGGPNKSQLLPFGIPGGSARAKAATAAEPGILAVPSGVGQFWRAPQPLASVPLSDGLRQLQNPVFLPRNSQGIRGDSEDLQAGFVCIENGLPRRFDARTSSALQVETIDRPTVILHRVRSAPGRLCRPARPAGDVTAFDRAVAGGLAVRGSGAPETPRKCLSFHVSGKICSFRGRTRSQATAARRGARLCRHDAHREFDRRRAHLSPVSCCLR